VNFKLKGLLFIFLLASLQMTAQVSKTLSLEEAINLSIQNNKQLKISQAKVEEASAATQEAIEKKLPDAKISGSYLRLNSANVDIKTKSNNNNGGSGSNESPKVSQAIYGTLNIALPIYNGGRIRYGIESAKFLEKATMLEAKSKAGSMYLF